MSTEPQAFAFISLLRDEVEARGLAGLLEGVARSTAATSSVFLVPDVRGRDFFASSDSQPAIDRWWGRHVPSSAVPVYLLCHEAGLAGWLYGMDGIVMVVADDQSAAAYSSWTVVRADPQAAPLALAEAVIIRFGEPREAGESRIADIFDRRDARLVAGVRDDASPRRIGRPQLPPLLRASDGEVGAARSSVAVPPDPFDLLVAESARTERESPVWKGNAAPPRARPGLGSLSRMRPLLPRLAGRHRGATTTDAALAALLVERGPTLVVIGSRKGGVGKTSHAAGIAIVAGGALDSVGHCAAIVDANIANPDAWGQLNLPGRAATVRDLAAALTSGSEPPRPVHASTPALACYPERREGTEYSRTDIRRLAAYLRARYTVTVIDMSNRLPDPMSGPEAAVAAFWLAEADVLVLPTASSRQDFNGVLDYLAVPDLPPTIVPCIVSGTRRNRRHPVVRQYLDAIAAQVACIIPIPDEADSVRLAGMDNAAVQDVSPKMRAAYRGLTEAVARLPARGRP